MKYLTQFSIIILFSFAAEIVKSLLPLPIPASIYGFILLFAALRIGIVKVRQIRETSFFLIEIMPIMFIPAAVGVMKHYTVFKGLYLQVAFLIFATTLFVMAVTAFAVSFMLKSGKEGRYGGFFTRFRIFRHFHQPFGISDRRVD